MSALPSPLLDHRHRSPSASVDVCCECLFIGFARLGLTPTPRRDLSD
jgi:hypothetical protein